MDSPPPRVEIFLQPGQFHFAGSDTRVRTLLGSCVSIVMWHEQLRIGGMCHYLLPSRAGARDDQPLDGRYGDEAMEMFMDAIRTACTRPQEYQVKIFGGGNMFPHYKRRQGDMNVPIKNALAANELVERYQLNVIGENLGGIGHRHLIFDIGSGSVWMHRAELSGNAVEGTPP